MPAAVFILGIWGSSSSLYPTLSKKISSVKKLKNFAVNNALAERGLPPIPFAAQARAAPDVSVFGARRLPTPAAQGPLNLLRA